MSGATIFSTFDITLGYHEVPVKATNAQKTAFTTKYLDNVIIFPSTFEEHLMRVKEILRRLREAKLKLKPEKCELLKSQVGFLGRVASKDGIRPNLSNTTKVIEASAKECY